MPDDCRLGLGRISPIGHRSLPANAGPATYESSPDATLSLTSLSTGYADLNASGKANMKPIVAKPVHRTARICSAAKIHKRASRDADGELAHLEQVVSAVRASTEIELPIGAAYWMTRIHDLRSCYELLPVQFARLSAIEQCVKDYEQDKWESLPIRRPAVA